jgi:hypothetical protein
MILCPFCHFQNEDGALFCEQCKSDLSGVEPEGGSAIPVAPVVAEAVAVAEDVEATPVVAIPEATPIEATPIEATPIPADTASSVPLAPIVPESPPAAPAETMPAGPSAAPPTAPPAPAPAQASPPAAGEPYAIPAGAQVRLVVLRGLKRNVEYPVYEGQNFIGRADEKPVDIDLEDQEPPDRVWSSRQHALITYENGSLMIEDLNSSNGTFLNRNKIYPAQPQPLKPNDVIQIGTVQLKVLV